MANNIDVFANFFIEQPHVINYIDDYVDELIDNEYTRLDVTPIHAKVDEFLTTINSIGEDIDSEYSDTDDDVTQSSEITSIRTKCDACKENDLENESDIADFKSKWKSIDASLDTVFDSTDKRTYNVISGSDMSDAYDLYESVESDVYKVEMDMSDNTSNYSKIMCITQLHELNENLTYNVEMSTVAPSFVDDLKVTLSEIESAIQSDAQAEYISSLLSKAEHQIAEFKAWYDEWGYAV